jgi:hypothetical protein
MKFRKDQLMYSKVLGEETHTDTHANTHTHPTHTQTAYYRGNLISLLFIQRKESTLKMELNILYRPAYKELMKNVRSTTTVL